MTVTMVTVVGAAITIFGAGRSLGYSDGYTCAIKLIEDQRTSDANRKADWEILNARQKQINQLDEISKRMHGCEACEPPNPWSKYGLLPPLMLEEADDDEPNNKA